MPKVKIDYSNIIFYKISCKDSNIIDTYIGHTTNFIQKKHTHKINCEKENNNYKLYNCIRENGGWNNWNMTIIDFHNCKDIYETKQILTRYIKEFKSTLNNIQPLPLKEPMLNTIEYNNSDSHYDKYKFYCKKCNYSCDKKSDFNKHINSKKHNAIECYKNDSINSLICKCGKTYKHSSSFYRHTKQCKNKIDINKNSCMENKNVDINWKEMFLEKEKQLMETQDRLNLMIKMYHDLVNKDL
tara:strand:+ start:12443 stop:13168 length:726 start_codon:yes stop_codon:yes gene_type:complete